MDDDEFDPEQFSMERLTRTTASLKRRTTVTVQNQPHDEEVAVSESESMASPSDAASTRGGFDASPSPSPNMQQQQQQQQQSGLQRQDSSQANSPAGAGGATQPQGLPGAYDPREYADLAVPEDVQELFKYIGRYQPPPLELLPVRLAPFIPDYIPAVGGADEFIKVPRPDGQPDHLGLKVLDEPAAVQSDPALLNLQLRALGKEAGGVRLQALGTVAHSDPDRAQRLASFISSIADLHKSRPVGGVAYSRPMPDVELLMQEWLPELEAAFRSSCLPGADLDLDLVSYAKLVCALLDVPVYGDSTLIEALHLLFSVFLAFKSNPYFRAQQGRSCASGSRALSTTSGGGASVA